MTNYTTAVELRGYIEMTKTTSDTVLAMIIEAASRGIDNFCNRPDGFVASDTATARVCAGSGNGVQFIDECVAVTSVAVKVAADDSTYEAWAVADWLAFSGGVDAPDFNRTPYNALMVAAGGDYDHFTSGEWSGIPGFRPTRSVQRSVPTVQVTARWGYAASVPAVVRQACVIHAARLWKRGQSAFEDATATPDFGALVYRQLDADVKYLLESGRLKRPAIG